MNVVIIVGGLPFGGIENLLFEIAKECQHRKNIDLTIINISGTGEKIQEFLDNDLKVINLYNDKRCLKVFKLSTMLKLRSLLKKLKPDIVHTMQFSGDYFGRLASIGLKHNIVTHIQSVRIEKKFHRRILNKILSFKTTCFISVSKSVYDVVEQYHNFFSKKHIVLYNAINLEKFQYRERKIANENNINLLAVGRLVSLKNFHLLIKSVAKLSNKFKKISLTIVGDGKEKVNLMKLINELKIEDKVKITGYKKNVIPYYNDAHIFIMPSEYEGFGIAHIEAIATGLPSIISKNVPSKEIAESCSLICDTTVDSIYECIEKLLTDKNLYETLSKNTEKIRHLFDIKLYVDKLLEIYNELLIKK
ncbi:glycosyltransferase [Deferribacter abyssi]|uniref:glycosyltransferase n=1 Tax=Deferribacter abyssi TaxID=213806 RepID=UPI003C1450A7